MRVCQRRCASSSISWPSSGFKPPLAVMKGCLQCLNVFLSSWQLRQSPRFSRRASARGERKPAAPKGRVFCLYRGINGKTLCTMMLSKWPAVRCVVKPRVLIPSATIATGTTLGPGCAHDWRAGSPTGWMTALPSRKQGDKKNVSPLTARVILCA